MLEIVSGARPTLVSFAHAKVLHAGPTVGKSTLARDINRSAGEVVVIDSDVVHRILSPDSEWVKLHRLPADAGADTTRVTAYAKRMQDALSGAIIREWVEAGGMAVTNLWGDMFAQALGAYAPEVSFMRDAPSFASVWEARGSDPLPEGMIEQWVANWQEAAANGRWSAALQVEEGEYLSDIVEFQRSPGSVDLSRLSPLCYAVALMQAAGDAERPDDLPEIVILYNARGSNDKFRATWRSLEEASIPAVSLHKLFLGRPGREGTKWSRPLSASERAGGVASALEDVPGLRVVSTCEDLVVAAALAFALRTRAVCHLADSRTTEAAGLVAHLTTTEA